MNNYEEDFRISKLTPAEWRLECDARGRKDAAETMLWMPKIFVEAMIWACRIDSWYSLWKFPIILVLFYIGIVVCSLAIPCYMIYAWYLMFKDIAFSIYHRRKGM